MTHGGTPARLTSTAPQGTEDTPERPLKPRHEGIPYRSWETSRDGKPSTHLITGEPSQQWSEDGFLPATPLAPSTLSFSPTALTHTPAGSQGRRGSVSICTVTLLFVDTVPGNPSMMTASVR